MKQPIVQYILSLLLFGSNGVAASQIHLASQEIVLLRAFLGILLLIALFRFTGGRFCAFQHPRDLFFLALSGAAMAADWLFLFEAYTRIGVSLSMIINYCGPILVIALSPLLFQERITLRKLAALALSVAGVILIINGQAAIEGIHPAGFLFACLSAVGYTAMVIFNKLSRQIKGMENAVWQLFFTFLTTAFFVACRQGLHMEIASGDWLPILWIGLLNTGVGCYLYFSSIGKLPAQTVAICGYLEPVAAVFFSILFLHETLQPLQILGAILVIVAAIL